MKDSFRFKANLFIWPGSSNYNIKKPNKKKSQNYSDSLKEYI